MSGDIERSCNTSNQILGRTCAHCLDRAWHPNVLDECRQQRLTFQNSIILQPSPAIVDLPRGDRRPATGTRTGTQTNMQTQLATKTFQATRKILEVIQGLGAMEG